jgi:hypothetical protein
LLAARKKPENKIGKGGFLIALKDPKEYVNKMNIVTFDSPEEPETKIQAKKIDSQDPTEAQ